MCTYVHAIGTCIWDPRRKGHQCNYLRTRRSQEGFVINGFVGKTGVYCQTCKHFVVAEGCKLPKDTGPGVEITCDQMWSKSGGDKVCKTTGDDDYTCDGKKDGQKPTVCYGCDQTQ
ncbi:hypothetical protein PSHT_08541 [Puccinia striiformis]|uniref:Uncharacterized protein n=1 Tax=Puccinia striiformis TaxID=27350 RepID=A0A2S4VP96_9BASI|nr:hypothetical protein PSHT_08541 [Puccinia striiformis]